MKFCSTFPRTAEENLAEYLQLLRISTPSSRSPNESEICVLSWSNLQKKIFYLGLQRREYICCSYVKGGRFYQIQDFFVPYLLLSEVSNILFCITISFYKKEKNFRSLKWLSLSTNSLEPIDNISCLAIVEPGVEP